MKQLRYQSLRFRAMLHSPGYFNESLWDTLSGEYYRSFATKSDYFHIFDYWRWNEEEIDDTLLAVRLGTGTRHQDNLADRRRHGGLLQLHLLHGRRLHRARHLPQQPDP